MWTERVGVPLLAVALAAALVAAPAAEGSQAPAEGAEGVAPDAERGRAAEADPPPGADEGDRPSGPEGLPEWSAWFAGRFSVYLNGAARSAGGPLVDQLGSRAYGEEARLQAEHVIGRAGMLDAGGSLRLWRSLAIGAGYAQLTTSDATTLTGAVPHPIRYGAFRELPPRALSLSHRQRVTHVFFAWRFPTVARTDASVFAGASLYNVAQGVITNVTVREGGGPPFAAVRVDQVQVGRAPPERGRRSRGSGRDLHADAAPGRGVAVPLRRRHRRSAGRPDGQPVAAGGRRRVRGGPPGPVLSRSLSRDSGMRARLRPS